MECSKVWQANKLTKCQPLRQHDSKCDCVGQAECLKSSGLYMLYLIYTYISKYIYMCVHKYIRHTHTNIYIYKYRYIYIIYVCICIPIFQIALSLSRKGSKQYHRRLKYLMCCQKENEMQAVVTVALEFMLEKGAVKSSNMAFMNSFSNNSSA